MKQPPWTVVQIFDRKTIGIVGDEYRIRQVTKAEADTIEELVHKLDIDPKGLSRTVSRFNAACRPGDYDPSVLGGKRTDGIVPPKSNWALPIGAPSFTGFVVTCGTTFTFGGLRINEAGEVQDEADHAIQSLRDSESVCCGRAREGVFYQNYLGGAGPTSGSVFGRIAGVGAGRRARTG